MTVYGGQSPAARRSRAIANDGRPKEKRPSKTKFACETFADQCKLMNLPAVEREYRFARNDARFVTPKTGRPRMWAFDFAFTEYKLAIELEGLVVRMIGGQLVTTGRHANVSGFREDCIKYCSAALLGWTVVRFELSQVPTRFALDMTIRLLTAKGWQQWKTKSDRVGRGGTATIGSVSDSGSSRSRS